MQSPFEGMIGAAVPSGQSPAYCPLKPREVNARLLAISPENEPPAGLYKEGAALSQVFLADKGGTYNSKKTPAGGGNWSH